MTDESILSSDSYLSWVNKNKFVGRDLNYYLGFLEGSRYDLPSLIDTFGIDELKPHLSYLMKFYDERLDKYEKFENNGINCGYDLFIWMLKQNKLNLEETVLKNAYLFWAHKGLILRTHDRLLEEAKAEAKAKAKANANAEKKQKKNLYKIKMKKKPIIKLPSKGKK